MSDKDMIIKTPEEAIETIKSNMPTSGYQMLRESLDMAIEALKEMQQYREIGTVEECLEAVEKQKPKKPKKVTNSGVRYTDEYVCPNCEQHFTGTGIAEYCYHCGQAINWEENEEE